MMEYVGGILSIHETPEVLHGLDDQSLNPPSIHNATIYLSFERKKRLF